MQSEAQISDWSAPNPVRDQLSQTSSNQKQRSETEIETDVENKYIAAKWGKEGGVNWEVGIDIHCYVKNR